MGAQRREQSLDPGNEVGPVLGLPVRLVEQVREVTGDVVEAVQRIGLVVGGGGDFEPGIEVFGSTVGVGVVEDQGG